MAQDPGGGARPWNETVAGRGQVVASAFGVVLRQSRQAAGRTQQEVAEAAGLHSTAVSLLERGQRQPTLWVVLQLSEVLGVPASDVVARVAAELGRLQVE